MSGALSKKHRASLKLRVEKMNEAKLKSRRCDTSRALLDDSATVSGLDDSLELPAPKESDESSDYKDFDRLADDKEYCSLYCDWIADMSHLDQQRIAMMLNDNYREQFGLLKTGAAANFFGICINQKTVRTWRKSFLEDPEGFGIENRGKHLRYLMRSIKKDIRVGEST